MKYSYISDLKQGKEVVIRGWIFESRILSKMAFLLIRDSSGYVQCIIKDSKILKQIQNLNLESIQMITSYIENIKFSVKLVESDEMFLKILKL